MDRGTHPDPIAKAAALLGRRARALIRVDMYSNHQLVLFLTMYHNGEKMQETGANGSKSL